MKLGTKGATRLGSYEVLGKLARGGMAELHLARTVGPEGFEKLVVLKKILPKLAESPRFVRLFLDEAKLAASLDHSNIVQVYDMGVVEGDYFFTMEYVHGQDVRTILRQAKRLDVRVPLGHALQIVSSVAAALHYAHERRGPDGKLLSIVHRDVSPSNILVSYDGAIKLLDFGVAKAATSSVKTRTGALKGKVAYMSPEQARGKTLDCRSDIFSLGIVLWQLITSERLFREENDLATIQKIINDPIPPPSDYVRCDLELDRIVGRALARDVAKRYQTCQELQSDLEDFARERKLKASSIGLSTFMSGLFALEIQSWEEAQASGATLADHVVAVTRKATLPKIDIDDIPELEHTLNTDPGVADAPTERFATESPVASELRRASEIPEPPGSDKPSEPSFALPQTLSTVSGVMPSATPMATEAASVRRSQRSWMWIGAAAVGAIAMAVIVVTSAGSSTPSGSKAPAPDLEGQVDQAGAVGAAAAAMPPGDAEAIAPPADIDAAPAAEPDESEHDLVIDDPTEDPQEARERALRARKIEKAKAKAKARAARVARASAAKAAKAEAKEKAAREKAATEKAAREKAARDAARDKARDKARPKFDPNAPLPPD